MYFKELESGKLIYTYVYFFLSFILLYIPHLWENFYFYGGSPFICIATAKSTICGFRFEPGTSPAAAGKNYKGELKGTPQLKINKIRHLAYGFSIIFTVKRNFP
jgi:hypothetical protein